jgi:hypothetical protein
MAKKTNSSTDNTSFHEVTFRASVNQIISAFGKPTIQDNTGEDKVNFKWDMETSEGDVFTIYDWKEYRELGFDQKVEWHIGAEDQLTSIIAKKEILKAL